MAAHPSPLPGWHAEHQCVVRDVASHHCSSANEGVPANYRSTHDRRIGSNRGATPHQGLLILPMPYDLRSWIDDIGKHTGWSAKHIVFEFNARVDRHIVLDLDVVADPDV